VLIRQRAELNACEQVSRIAHDAAGCELLQGAVHGFCGASPLLPHQRPRGEDRIGPNRRDDLVAWPTGPLQVLIEQYECCVATSAVFLGR